MGGFVQARAGSMGQFVVRASCVSQGYLIYLGLGYVKLGTSLQCQRSQTVFTKGRDKIVPDLLSTAEGTVHVEVLQVSGEAAAGHQVPPAVVLRAVGMD